MHRTLTNRTRQRMWRPPVRAGATALTAMLAAAGVAVAVPGTAVEAPEGSCPRLQVFGVQGSEESSPGAVSTSDTGALGQLFGPLQAAAGELVGRTYIPFADTSPAGTTYRTAIIDAAQELETQATGLVQRCPATQIAVAGYAHGAPAVADFAHKIGAGHSAVPADRVAGIVLLANPTRAMGTPAIPGRPTLTTPASAPGTRGQHLAAVTVNNSGVSGAGIDAAAHTPDFGSLTGRVADLCVAGDATCDTTPGSPLARTVAHVIARTAHRDPVTAISTLAAALAGTVFTTGVEVITHDLTGTSLDQLAYNPTKTLGERLADASAPTAVPPGPDQALAALFKLGTLGLGAVVTVARTVFTPATVAELATVGLANPAAAVAVLGAKVAAAVVELVPPQTALGWVNDAFDAATSLITDPSDLYTVAGTATYSSTSGRRGSYRTDTATPGQSSVFSAVSHWFTALARDLAATGTTSPTETTPPRSATPPAARPRAGENSSTPPTSGAP